MMAAEHFFAKAWSLSFEQFSQKIRDFLKNLLLKEKHAAEVRHTFILLCSIVIHAICLQMQDRRRDHVHGKVLSQLLITSVGLISSTGKDLTLLRFNVIQNMYKIYLSSIESS